MAACVEAATLIETQAARIAELEALVERARVTLDNVYAPARDTEWDEGFNYAMMLCRAAIKQHWNPAPKHRRFGMDVEELARKMGATPADIAGLWNMPGYPELTTGQLLNIASMRIRTDIEQSLRAHLEQEKG